jgi:hypothetical protein
MTLYLLETEKIGVSRHRPLSRKRPISDPGAKFFGREPQFSERKKNSQGGQLVETAAAEKIGIGCLRQLLLDDFHKLLGYPSKKRARISTVPTSSATK